MQAHWWAIERQLPGGTEADWVEICRCDSAANVAAVVASILGSAQPPDVLRIKQALAGI